MNHSDLIHVSGNTGLIGSAVVSLFKSKGFINVLCLSLEEFELTEQSEVEFVFEKYASKYVLLTEKK